MGWFTGRGRAVALVLACLVSLASAGLSLWRDSSPTAGPSAARAPGAGPPAAGRSDASPAEPRTDAAARGAAVGPARRLHILEGDRTGGGHRPGRGLPGKSEFPPGWSDERIIAAIEDVANDPAASRRVEGDGRTVVSGRRDAVALRVVVERDGRAIITGYPTNTPRNPDR